MKAVVREELTEFETTLNQNPSQNMETFTDLESTNFYCHEWLVKVDNANSRPYLFKYHCSPENRCSVLVTDTVSVWFEALDIKHLARRWRLLNGTHDSLADTDQEHEWRTNIIRKVSIMHTLKSVQHCLLSIGDSQDADLAIELQDLDYKWRWECYLLGPKTSARVLSKHLISPLLSMANLAFTSADSLGALSTTDLQTAVDKVARAGRRAEDIHVRQTLSQPRVALTLARLTALLNFSENIPAIIDEAEEADDNEIPMNTAGGVPISNREPSNERAEPEFKIETTPSLQSHVTPTTSRQKKKGKAVATPTVGAGSSDGSATEPESAGGDDTEAAAGVPKNQPDDDGKIEHDVAAAAASPQHEEKSDSDTSSPIAKRPSKKTKLSQRTVSDSSGAESNATPSSATREKAPARAVRVRQPIRRGGRKF